MTYLLLYTRVDVGPDTTFVLDWALKANYFLALSSGDTTVSLVSRQTLPSSQDRTEDPRTHVQRGKPPRLCRSANECDTTHTSTTTTTTTTAAAVASAALVCFKYTQSRSQPVHDGWKLEAGLETAKHAPTQPSVPAD